MIGIALIVISNDVVSSPIILFAVIVMSLIPLSVLVGVPVTRPVFAFSVSPSGISPANVADGYASATAVNAVIDVPATNVLSVIADMTGIAFTVNTTSWKSLP